MMVLLQANAGSVIGKEGHKEKKFLLRLLIVVIMHEKY